MFLVSTRLISIKVSLGNTILKYFCTFLSLLVINENSRKCFFWNYILVYYTKHPVSSEKSFLHMSSVLNVINMKFKSLCQTCVSICQPTEMLIIFCVNITLPLCWGYKIIQGFCHYQWLSIYYRACNLDNNEMSEIGKISPNF